MSDQTYPGPRLKNPPEREMIPRVLVRAMFSLALASLLIVSFAVVTEREHVGQPKPAPVVESRQMIITGDGSKAVQVTTPGGEILADMAHGGFIAVVQNGLARERMKQSVPQTLPVEVVRYANGRLALHDPHTKFTAELGNFGDQNKAAFERLMNK